MMEWLFDTLEEIFNSANQALTSAFKLAIIGFILFLAWKYTQVLIRCPVKTITTSLAILSFPLLFSLIPFVHQHFLKDYLHFNIGVCISSFVPFLIAGSFGKKSNTGFKR